MDRIKRRIVLLATPPPSGREKTVHAAFLTDTVASVSHLALTTRLHVEVLLAWDGPADALPDTVQSMPFLESRGNSPGERIVSLCEASFATNIAHLVIVGNDTPHLPTAFVQEAFGRLSQGADAVFGPTDSGGFYLVGLRKPIPALFAQVPWGTGDILKTILNVAATSGIQTALLPSLYTIDTDSDLHRLQIDIKRGVVFAPATSQFLASQ